MTKKHIYNPENPNGILVDMTAEEEAQREIESANAETEKAQIQADKEDVFSYRTTNMAYMSTH